MSLRQSRSPDSSQPVLLVLKNPDAERWASASLISDVANKINTAHFEARGIGETGWDPSLHSHVRRAAAWTGRTLASMRVYDVLRCLEVLREMPSVNSDSIGLVAEGEMAAIAAYAALLDGNIKTLILRDPPASQNMASAADGKGAAIEMLNCLRITDLPQVVGLMYPNDLIIIGDLPPSYYWTEDLYRNLDKPEGFKKVPSLSEWLED